MFFRRKAFDGLLPALSVRGPELRLSLRVVTIAYMLCMVHVACITGSQINSYGEMLGFGDREFGLLQAIPFIATFAQIFAAMAIERTGLRKHVFLWFMTISRLIWVPIALIPLFVDLPSTKAIWAMLFLMSLTNVLGAVASPAWWTWMGDLIPRRIRGRYMASRERASQIVRIVGFLVVGILLDWAASHGSRGTGPAQAAQEPYLLKTISIIFAIGSLFGAADILLFHRIRELLPTIRQQLRPQPSPDLAGAGDRRLQEGVDVPSDSIARIFHPFQDQAFARFVAYVTVMNFGVCLAAPYFYRNAMNHMGFTNLASNMLFLVIGTFAGILSAKWFGRAIDRWGRRPVLMLSTFCVAVTVLVWLVITPATWDFGVTGAINWAWSRLAGQQAGTLIPPGAPVGGWLWVAASCMIGGASWTGITLAQNSTMLAFSESQGRSMYVATYSAVSSLGGALGGLTGGFITGQLGHLQTHPLQVGPWAWNQWQVVILLSALIRLVAMGIVWTMPDPMSKPLGEMLRSMLGRSSRKSQRDREGAPRQT